MQQSHNVVVHDQHEEDAADETPTNCAAYTSRPVNYGGNYSVVFTVAAIPEPGAVVLLIGLSVA